MTDITTVQTYPTAPEIELLMTANTKLKKSCKSLKQALFMIAGVAILATIIYLIKTKSDERQ